MWFFERFHVQGTGLLLVLWLALATATNDRTSLAEQIKGDMDLSIDPCSDLYSCSCINWMNKNEIPNRRGSYSRFDEVEDIVQKRLKVLLEMRNISYYERNYMKKAKDMYAACMNEEKLVELGTQPLKDLLKELHFWPYTQDASLQMELEPALIELNQLVEIGKTPFLNVDVNVDNRNSSRHIVKIYRGYSWLRSSHVEDGRQGDGVQRFEGFVSDLFDMLLGHDWFGSVSDVVDFEFELVGFSDDDDDVYQDLTLSELKRRIPGFSWETFLEPVFHAAGQNPDDNTEVMVYSEGYLRFMIQLCSRTNSKIIADYMMMNVMKRFKEYLAADLRHFNIRDTIRWQECVEDTTKFMEAAVGKLYCDGYFLREDEAKILRVVNDVQYGFRVMLINSSWLTPQSIVAIADKLSTIEKHIGFPTMYDNSTYMNQLYKDVSYTNETHFENSVQAFRWLRKQNFQTLSKSTDREHFSVLKTNYLYGKTRNDIVLPAANFVPPFYDSRYPMSMVFGAVGMFIGHEMAHAISPNGRRYNVEANEEEWWSDDQVELYEASSECFVKQYGDITVETSDGSMHIDGTSTLNENVADNMGLDAAFHGYKAWESFYGPEPLVEGLEEFSHEQLFFIAGGRLWCILRTLSDMKKKIERGHYSPQTARCNVPTANFEAAARAFNCPKGANMNPSHRCKMF